MGWMESQIETRAKFDAELTERAYAELAASVTDPKRAPSFSVSDIEQADGAVKTCLKFARVEPGNVPDNISEIEDRIDWLCRPSGTLYRNVRLEGTWYKQAFGAMLGKLDTGEPIALLPSGMRGYCYLEPGNGQKVKVNASTASRISPDAVLFYMPLPARPCTVRDLVAFIFRVFSRMDYLLVLVAAVVATLIGLLPAQANKIAFDTVVPSGQADLIAPIGALLLGVAVSTVLIGACRNLIMSRVAIKLNIAAEAATFARVLSLPTSFFKQYASGDLASRIANVTALAESLSAIILGAGLTSALSIVYIIQIGAYASELMFPAFIIIVTEVVLTICVTFVTARYERMTMESNAKLSGTVTALLNGIQKVKLAGAEDRAFAKWAHGYSEYARLTYNRPLVLYVLPALVALVGILGGIAIYVIAGSSHITVANYMAFNVAFGQASAAMAALANMAGQLAQIGPMLDMVAPILEAAPEIAEDKPSIDELSGAIEVSGLSFRYGEDEPYVVKNLSFAIKPGEYVAIVGRSGCGKSTIMRLLLGFEEAERGSVFYDSHDIRKVDLRSLRQHVGTVMQGGSLFMGDIASNILISTPTGNLDDAWAAAEVAGIADDIRKMPMGMQTFITEGAGGVSGGQRQRLMIARAVCGKRKILMFDEATSALDNKTQKHVADSLAALKCTRVVIAHRLSTVRHCDRILVVDGGTIVEEGSYEELIAKDGLFAELVARQRLDTEA